jgi:hypothetical protein
VVRGIRVVDLLSIFWKREKHGGMHLAITILIKLCILTDMAVNTDYSFYILDTQNDIKFIPTSISMLLVVTSELIP